jgi:hypothetical protein
MRLTPRERASQIFFPDANPSLAPAIRPTTSKRSRREVFRRGFARPEQAYGAVLSANKTALFTRA